MEWKKSMPAKRYVSETLQSFEKNGFPTKDFGNDGMGKRLFIREKP